MLVSVAVLIALTITTIGLQLLQNGRGWIGIYGQYPFRAAYVDFSAQAVLSEKVRAEQWLLAQTVPTDVIGIWTDPARMMAAVAAMQLWGMNNNVSETDTLTTSDIGNLDNTRPTAIAMYAPKREEIDHFWTSIPGRLTPTAPDCITVVIPGIGVDQAYVCLTHLHWSR